MFDDDQIEYGVDPPSDGYDLPELGRIGSLMDDLYGDFAPLAKAGPAKAARVASRAVTRPTGGKAAALPLALFARAINWHNAEGFRSVLTPDAPARPRLGGVSVAAFSRGVNWKNAAAGPKTLPGVGGAAGKPTAGPPETLETFLDSFAWE